MGRMDNKLKNKKLLVLGGTQISCQIVHIARAMGCFVGVADYNRIEDSPGKQIADAAYDVSVTDIDAVVKKQDCRRTRQKNSSKPLQGRIVIKRF